MGTPDFAVASLDAICRAGYDVVGVVTVPDRQTGRGLKVTFSPVKQYAIEHNLPLLQPEKLRDAQFQDDLRAWDADIFVVVAFRMLPQSVWAMPRRGTFNLHASLLPQYRGAAPINWAIINGERETGVTTFMLNERIDEGGILLQQATPISADDDAGSLHDRLAEMGRRMVIETLRGIDDGTVAARPQRSEPSLKPAPKIFKSDCVVDWQQDGQRVVDFIRGLSPYPAATATLTDTKGRPLPIKIYKAAFEPADGSVSGQVMTDGKTYIKIGVPDGYVSLLSIQLSGKRRMSVEEFLRGCRISC